MRYMGCDTLDISGKSAAEIKTAVGDWLETNATKDLVEVVATGATLIFLYALEL